MPPCMAGMTSTLSFCQECMTHCVTKAIPKHFIDGKCYIKKLKGKSSKTCLTGSISHHWSQVCVHTHPHPHTNITDKSNQARTGFRKCTFTDSVA